MSIVYELYSVGILGANRVRLHSILGGGEEVNEFRISPDSQKVVYQRQGRHRIYDDLYAAWIDGSAYIPLTDVEERQHLLAHKF